MSKGGIARRSKDWHKALVIFGSEEINLNLQVYGVLATHSQSLRRLEILLSHSASVQEGACSGNNGSLPRKAFCSLTQFSSTRRAVRGGHSQQSSLISTHLQASDMATNDLNFAGNYALICSWFSSTALSKCVYFDVTRISSQAYTLYSHSDPVQTRILMLSRTSNRH
jgi:hypothetical protein